MQPMFKWTLALIAAVGITACAAKPPDSPTALPTRAVTLTPYNPQARSSPTFLPTPEAEQPLPSPSPTPQTHTVVKGEDMFGIALRYGLSVEALKAANPDVNPNFLSIGAVLVIPGGGLPAPTPANPSPTPIPLQLSGPDCWPGADGSQTCFVLASNPSSSTLENLAVLIRTAADSGETVEQEAYGLLNLLPPGESLPLLALFPVSPEGRAGRASTELIRAFPLAENDARYTALELMDVDIDIAPNGMSAVVRGAAVLPGSQGAQTAWIAAWALDAQGRVVAARRWEAPGALASGTAEPFSLTLYSLGGQIDAVNLLAEARP